MGFLVYGENKCPSPEFGFLKNIEFSWALLTKKDSPVEWGLATLHRRSTFSLAVDKLKCR
jgi:hypothetical protein